MGPKKMSESQKVDIQPLVNIPQINLFTRENLQVSIDSVFSEEIYPSFSWESGGKILFTVSGNPECFVDPSSIRVIMELKILTHDGRQMPAAMTGNYAPIANAGCSIFEKVSVRLGHSTCVSSPDSLYPYLTYLNNIFKTPEAMKKQINFPLLLYEDQKVYFDQFDTRNSPGFKSRTTACARSKPMYLSVPIHSPITMQDKLLIPGIDINIRMVRAKNSFLLMSKATEEITVQRQKPPPAAEGAMESVQETVDLNPKIELSMLNYLIYSTFTSMLFSASIKLMVRKYKLMPLLHNDIMNGLRSAPAIYGTTFSQICEFTRLSGTTVIRETLFTDRILPKVAHLFIVTTKRRLGDYKLR